MALTKVSRGLLSTGIVDNSTTTAITIDSSENVGIGITDPDQALEIGAGGKLKLSRADNARSLLLFNDNSNSTIQSDTDPLLIQSANIITFNTNGANERMRIDAGGNVGIGTSSPSTGYKLHLAGDNTMLRMQHTGSGGNGYLDLNVDSTVATINANYASSAIDFRILTASTERMRIAADGSITMPAVYDDTTAAAANMHISSAGGLLFRSTSSARYKNTITDATHGLTELLTLRSVTYKGNNDGDTVFGGLIAEEVHDAGLTEFVQYNDEDEPDALAYGNMVSLCIKAIQELKEELNTATARITELENN